MTLSDKITGFFELRPDESYSAFTVAAHIGAAKKSVAAVMAKMANENRLRKQERGFYRSTKGPALRPSLFATGELHS